MSKENKFKEWFNNRFPLKTFNYEVPKHANTFLFSLGGVTLISVVILIITGVILAVFYSPNPELANQSIRIFVTDVKLGSLIRGLHVWAATVAVITLILHLLRVLFYGSYKKPRELHWLFGVALFVIMIGLIFTGTVLKWDQEASEALAHAQELGKLAGVGFFFTFAAKIPILTKFFVLHTSILPLLLFVLIGIHLFLVKQLKISQLPWKAKNEETAAPSINRPKYTFAQHGLKLVGYGFIAFGLLVLLAVIYPPALGPIPTEGLEATKPPWLFMGIFSIENWAGLPGLLWASVAIVVLLILVPFADRAKTQLIKERKLIVSVSAIVVLLLGGLTINAYATKPKQHIGMASMEGANIQIDNAAVAKGLDASLSLVGQLKKDIASKDQAGYQKDAAQLNEGLLPLKTIIMTKDAKAGDKIKSDQIASLLSGKSPDLSKAGTLVASTEAGIKQAQTLFPVGITAITANALTGITKTEAAIAKQDKEAALAQAEELDGSIDPAKDAIKELDPSLVANLDTDGLAETLNAASPDWTKAATILTTMKDALVKAGNLDMTSQLDKENAIVTKLLQAIQNKELSAAREQAEQLDATLDPLKDRINEKNPAIVKEMETDGLNEEVSKANPDWSKAQSLATQMQKAINDAKGLFK
ncbi:cytochrome b [Neobacillus sp. SM06]|uniref:cytochrome b n=1 Tax=Neobacillus sp. SM06 TaxID=3422492 RepID=UPI003D29D529